jgi:hypothetical protein
VAVATAKSLGLVEPWNRDVTTGLRAPAIVVVVGVPKVIDR